MRGAGFLGAAVAILVTIAACSAGDGNPYFDRSSPYDVVGKTPDDLATDVPVDVVIEAEFGGDVNGDDAEQRFRLEIASTSTAVPGVADYGADRVLRFDPNAPLAPDTEYRVVIDGVRDEDGKPIARESWTIHTAQAPPVPRAVGRVPLPGRTNVPVNFVVRVSFNVALQPGSVMTVQWQPTTGGGFTNLPGDLSYDTASQSLVFLPLAPPPANSEVRVQLTPNSVRDVYGRAIDVALVNWTFDVATASDGVKPVLNAAPVPAETPANSGTVLVQTPAVTDAAWSDDEILFEGVVAREKPPTLVPCADPFDPRLTRIAEVGSSGLLAFPGLTNGLWTLVLEAEDGAGRRSAAAGPVPFTVQAGAVTFADVQPLLQERCALGGCHAGASTPGNLDLDAVTPNDLITAESTYEGLPQVEPFCLERSYLWRKIAAGYAVDGGLMPPPHTGVNSLSREERDLIRAWIEQGAN